MPATDHSSLNRDTPWVIAGAIGFLAVLIILGGRAAGLWRPAAAPQLAPGFLLRSMDFAGETNRYAVWVPPSARAGAAVPASMPLIVFLHGSAEAGRDGILPTAVGLGPALNIAPDRWPALALFPQIKPGEQWTDRTELLFATIEAAAKDFPVDRARISLVGLSTGGSGVWEAASQRPSLFAAIVPICAQRREIAFAAVARVPTWIAHGQLDDVISVAESRFMIDALKAAGGNPTVTIFPDARHEAWDPLFTDPAFAPWLLGQKLAAP